MQSSHTQEKSWTEPDSIYLLTSVLKDASVDCVALLLGYINERKLSVRWDNILLPQGHSLSSCKTHFDELMGKPVPQYHVPIPYPFQQTPWQPPSSGPGPGLAPVFPESRKRPLPDPEITQPARTLQPRPPSFQGAPIFTPVTNGEKLAPMRPSPSDAAGEPARKRGRPSKEELEKRQREAEAQGKVYEGSRRRKPKKPVPDSGPPLNPAQALIAAAVAPPGDVTMPQQSGSAPAEELPSGKEERHEEEEHLPSADEFQTSNTDRSLEPGSGPTAAVTNPSPSDRLRPEPHFTFKQPVPSPFFNIVSGAPSGGVPGAPTLETKTKEPVSFEIKRPPTS